MIIVLGATGHVGSAVADALLANGEPITIVTRDEGKADQWKTRGAEAAVVDVLDAGALRVVFRRGRSAFLLNPPADPSTDTDVEEHRTLASIVAALDGSGLERVVLESTYGAQPGDRIGDLNVLHDFEEALRAQPIPATMLRAAYYMSNWNPLLDAARKGVLPTMLPVNLKLPMVAPADIGQVAARLLRDPDGHGGIHHVEGPERYSASDVANAFAAALGRPVDLQVTPRDKWEHAYRELGFSAPAAIAYTRMTQVTVDGGVELPPDPDRGHVTIEGYVFGLVERSA